MDGQELVETKARNLSTPGSTGPAQPADAGGPPAERCGPAELLARNLRETSAGLYLYGASATVIGGAAGTDGCLAYVAYIAQLLRDAGDPADPVERMLIEQLALAHHAVGRLHVRAADVTDDLTAAALLGVAARLLGELRKAALALQAYRQAAAPAAVGHAQSPEDDRGERDSRGGLGSNGEGPGHGLVARVA